MVTDSWNVHHTNYTDKDKEVLLQEVIRVLVKMTFDTHIYKWANKIYKQLKGGGIGLRATGSIARCVMAIFLDTLHAMMTGANMEVRLLRNYDDDIPGITKKLELGSRYKEGNNHHERRRC